MLALRKTITNPENWPHSHEFLEKQPQQHSQVIIKDGLITQME